MPAEAIIAMLHIINVKDIVSQTVLTVVFSSFFIFFSNDTKFKQNVTHNIGIKNHPTYQDATTIYYSPFFELSCPLVE